LIDLITILGPTASGKTPFATALAYELDTEIISADSRQVYRLMDIGTGKDLSDYVVEGKKIPYHLIDIAEPGYKYNLFEYKQDFAQTYEQIKQKGKLPILCGGTGLYIEAVLKDYQLLAVPENPKLRKSLEHKTLAELSEILKNYKNLHNSTDIDTAKRAIRAIEIAEYQNRHEVEKTTGLPITSLIIGLDISREERRVKITKRLKERLTQGMIEEVEQIMKNGVPAEDLIYYGLEYKYITNHIIGNLNFDEMTEQLETAIHQFAKRQMTWFRGMEKRGFKIHWIDALLPNNKKVEKVKELLKNQN
jgi:tRNA dimethylallyltransferase